MTNPASTSAPTFGLSYDPWGRLVLIDAEGARHVGVEPVRAFPIADPARWISICDSVGRELFLLESFAGLPQNVRQILEEELGRREFMPIIERIEHIVTEAEPTEWSVVTDRGATKFLVNSADDVRRVGSDQAAITDMQGIRYMIASLRHLDARSRRWMEHYI
jgi:hypothetical protein